MECISFYFNVKKYHFNPVFAQARPLALQTIYVSIIMDRGQKAFKILMFVSLYNLKMNISPFLSNALACHLFTCFE